MSSGMWAALLGYHAVYLKVCRFACWVYNVCGGHWRSGGSSIATNKKKDVATFQSTGDDFDSMVTIK